MCKMHEGFKEHERKRTGETRLPAFQHVLYPQSRACPVSTSNGHLTLRQLKNDDKSKPRSSNPDCGPEHAILVRGSEVVTKALGGVHRTKCALVTADAQQVMRGSNYSLMTLLPAPRHSPHSFLHPSNFDTSRHRRIRPK